MNHSSPSVSSPSSPEMRTPADFELRSSERRRLLGRSTAILALVLTAVGITSQMSTAVTTSTQQPAIASNFATAAYISSGHGIPESSAAEPTGDFRFICSASHYAYDDPIVYPGQSGASHLHMFFGNSTTDANSTYESLRTNGGGSCQGGPLNRSAYWAPALLDGTGNVLVPSYATVYYKGTFGGVAGIQSIPALPRGLRMIAGHNMASPSSSTGFNWYCESGAGSKTQTIHSCPAGDKIGAVLQYPQCWDGVNLDSANHRSHMAYLYYDPNSGQPTCPSTHPVHVPEFTLGIWFPMPAGQNVSAWQLASDTMAGMTHAPGSTFHADWIGAWDDTIMTKWVSTCIHGLLNCGGGQMGDGSVLVTGNDPNNYGFRTLPMPAVGSRTTVPNPSNGNPTAGGGTPSTPSSVPPVATTAAPSTAPPTSPPGNLSVIGQITSNPPCPWIVLKSGMSDPIVGPDEVSRDLIRRLQTALHITETAAFDSATIAAVKAMEASLGWAQTGQVERPLAEHLGIQWDWPTSCAAPATLPPATTAPATTAPATAPSTAPATTAPTTTAVPATAPTTTRPATTTTAAPTTTTPVVSGFSALTVTRSGTKVKFRFVAPAGTTRFDVFVNGKYRKTVTYKQIGTTLSPYYTVLAAVNSGPSGTMPTVVLRAKNLTGTVIGSVELVRV